MKIIFTTLLLVSLFACSDNKDSIIDQFAPVSIRGVEATKAIGFDSVLHTLTKSYQLTFIDTIGGEWMRDLGIYDDYWNTTVMQRDTINRRFLFAGIDVIEKDLGGDIHLGMFINNAKDVLFISALDSLGNTICPRTNQRNDFFEQYEAGGKRDTIGYIPNAVLKSAQEQITIAFNVDDYETCYRLFDEAMIFIPTTSAEYRRLKAEAIE